MNVNEIINLACEYYKKTPNDIKKIKILNNDYFVFFKKNFDKENMINMYYDSSYCLKVSNGNVSSIHFRQEELINKIINDGKEIKFK